MRSWICVVGRLLGCLLATGAVAQGTSAFAQSAAPAPVRPNPPANPPAALPVAKPPATRTNGQGLRANSDNEEARRQEDERLRRWDERMRRATRSMCDRC